MGLARHGLGAAYNAILCEAWDAGRTLPGLTWVSFLLGNEHSMGKCRHLGASGRRGDGGEEPADIIFAFVSAAVVAIVAAVSTTQPACSLLSLLSSLPLSLRRRHCLCVSGTVPVE